MTENTEGPYRFVCLGKFFECAAVKMLAMVGIKDVMQNAYNMGIENWQPTDANMADVGTR